MHRFSGRWGCVHSTHLQAGLWKALLAFWDQKGLLFGIKDIHVVWDGCLLYKGMGMVHDASAF
jgi:hypothetical protein